MKLLSLFFRDLADLGLSLLSSVSSFASFLGKLLGRGEAKGFSDAEPADASSVTLVELDDFALRCFLGFNMSS